MILAYFATKFCNTMISPEIAAIQEIAIHKVGSNTSDEGVKFAQSSVKISDHISNLLIHYFFSPFKSEEYFNFYHENGIGENEIFKIAAEIFESPDQLFEKSKSLANFLYENSSHPKIKGGEFYVVYFNDCIVDGEQVDAVGLFKSESKETYLKVMPTDENYDIGSDSGININKLDKGCLIFDTEKENGYLVAVVDNLSKGTEAQYWFDHFLHVRQREDVFFKTQSAIKMTREFVTEKMPLEFELDKADQADILNKSKAFFKEHESFDFDDFTSEVMQEPRIIESFKNHKRQYETDHQLAFEDSFDISAPAVKKTSNVFKSVIKLDKNFHIYVHGNRDRIRRGYDEETGMHFYQCFFEEEN
jgi:hypothetical protein